MAGRDALNIEIVVRFHGGKLCGTLEKRYLSKTKKKMGSIPIRCGNMAGQGDTKTVFQFFTAIICAPESGVGRLNSRSSNLPV